MSSFLKKVVIVTGASSGIGEGIAKIFASRGASLILTGRNVEKLNSVAEECKTKGAEEVLPVTADFQKLPDVKNIVDKAVKKFGKIDVLVNNAGVIKNAFLAEVTMEDFDWIFQVNVKSLVYLTQLSMPHLEKTKGNIVNVSSIRSFSPKPSVILYSMTKSAIDQFTKTIAVEYASKGVRVNAVNPGSVRTNLSRDRGWTEEQIDEMYRENEKIYPIGRIGTADDIGEAVLFLASDASSWTTGQCLTLDGGITLVSQA